MGTVTAGTVALNEVFASSVCLQLAAWQLQVVRSCSAPCPVSIGAATRCSCPAEGVTQIILKPAAVGKSEVFWQQSA